MSNALPQTFVDSEGAVRTWARASATITAVAGTRSFFGIPENYSGAWPLLTLARVGGAPEQPIAPVDRALIQFDCWGPPSKQEAGKYLAASLATAVVTAARELVTPTEMGTGVIGMGADVELGPVWSPDPETDQARYVIDVAFYLRVD